MHEAHWNYRIIAHKQRLCNILGSRPVLFSIHEVYYRNNEPVGWVHEPLHFGNYTSVDMLRQERSLMKGAFKKPVLTPDENDNLIEWREQ